MGFCGLEDDIDRLRVSGTTPHFGWGFYSNLEADYFTGSRLAVLDPVTAWLCSLSDRKSR